MSKLTDSFRTVGVFNQHNFAAGTPLIRYSIERRAWFVSKDGCNFRGHWSDYGARRFSVAFMDGSTHAKRKAAAFEQAKAWASERFGVAEWARTPYGSFGPADFVASRLAELKAAVPTGGSAASEKGLSVNDGRPDNTSSAAGPPIRKGSVDDE